MANIADHFDIQNLPSTPRILIIDDERGDAELLAKALNERWDRDFEAQHTSLDIAIVTDASSVQPYISNDGIDIYIVDLKLRASGSLKEDKFLGEELIGKISEATNAGIIVYSSEPADTEEARSLSIGADYYIWKSTPARIKRARVLALWRQIRLTRPSVSSVYTHTNRTFLIGDWRFTVGNRELKNGGGQIIRLSPLEHAFMRYVAVVEGHEVDKESFNVHVLGRESYENDRRLDNLVSRLRSKLGDNVGIISTRDGGYRLLSVREVRNK
jgi:DNA-binding response OmpR family regulator